MLHLRSLKSLTQSQSSTKPWNKTRRAEAPLEYCIWLRTSRLLIGVEDVLEFSLMLRTLCECGWGLRTMADSIIRAKKKVLNLSHILYRLRIHASSSTKLISYVLYWTYWRSQVPKALFFYLLNEFFYFKLFVKNRTSLLEHKMRALADATLRKKNAIYLVKLLDGICRALDQ